MNEILKSRWHQLAVREQRLIAWGGGGLLAALLYAYAWQPISQERQKLHSALPKLQADATLVLALAREAEQLKSQPSGTAPPQGPQEAVLQAANHVGIDGKNINIIVLDQKRVRIEMASIPFDACLSLLGELYKTSHAGVASTSIEKHQGTSRVNFNAVLNFPRS